MRIDKYYHLYGRKNDVVFEEVQGVSPRWIPCKERLPEHGYEVLVSVTGELYDLEYRFVCFAYYDRKGKCWIYNGEQADGIVAWMDVPEPYKEV